MGGGGEVVIRRMQLGIESAGHSLRICDSYFQQGTSRATGVSPALFPILQSRDTDADHHRKL